MQTRSGLLFSLPLLLFAMAQTGTAKVTIEVKGLADEELVNAVKAGISLNQYQDRDISKTQAVHLSARIPDESKKALLPYGYFDSEVTFESHQQEDDWTFDVTVKLNKPVTVSQLDIDLSDEAKQLWPLKFALKRFKPQVGDILNQGQYTDSKERINKNLAAAGFFDADMTRHKVSVRRKEHDANIDLAWKTGKRYHYGETKFEGSQFREKFLYRYMPWHPGEPFDQNDLLELQQRLSNADYFSVVNVTPDVEQRHDDTVDVDVELKPAKRSIYTGGPFVGTDTGVGIQGGLERRWVNDRGHKLKHRIVLAQKLKMVNSLYTIPIADERHHAWNFGVKYRDANTKTSQSKTFELIGNQTFLYHQWLVTAGMHVLAGTFTVGAKNSKDKNLPGVEHGRSTLVYPEITLVRKHARNPNFVRHGWGVTLTARSTVGSMLSDTRFHQFLADGKWITSFNRQNRLILSAKLGYTDASDFKRLHPQLRFFDGGTEFNRGFAYQDLGPFNSYGRIVGGNRLISTQTTLEHYFTRNWGIATFVDAGNAFNGTDFTPQYSAGLGLRWRSPIGMLRVDLGKSVHGDRHGGMQFNLSIGPDL